MDLESLRALIQYYIIQQRQGSLAHPSQELILYGGCGPFDAAGLVVADCFRDCVGLLGTTYVCKCSVIGVGDEFHSEVWDHRQCTQ